MSSETVSGPSGIGPEAGRTDVTDPDASREELIRLAEDLDAEDWETAEARTTALLSDVRRAKAGGSE